MDWLRFTGYYLLPFIAVQQGALDNSPTFMDATPKYKCVSSLNNNEKTGRRLIVNLDFNINATKHNQECYETAPSGSRQPCLGGYVYENGTFHATSVTEFDLVCDRALTKTLGVSTFFQIGVLGALVGGFLGDTYGRVNVSLICLTIYQILTVLSTLAPSALLYFAGRSVEALAMRMVYANGMALASDVKPPQPQRLEKAASTSSKAADASAQRSRYIITYCWMWSFGIALSSATSYFIPHWHKIHMFMLALSVISSLCLVSMKITGDGAQMEKHVEASEGEEGRQKTLFSLLTYSWLTRSILLTICLSFFVSGLILFWFIMDLTGERIFLTKTLMALVDIPATICVGRLSEKKSLGRIPILATCFLIAAIVAVVTVSLQSVQSTSLWITTMISWSKMGLDLLGRFCVCGAWNLSYVYIAEVVPSPMKSTAIGLGTAFGATGGSLAPYLLHLRILNWWFPLAVSIILAVFTSFAVFRVLPETKTAPTFTSLEEAVVFYVKARSIVGAREDCVESTDLRTEIILDCNESS